MSETMNLRPFSNLPETDEIKEGDKVLVNQDGMAKQLDASKIGGSSGGGMLYAQMISATEAYIYADEGYTRMLTYDEAKTALMLGATAIAKMSGNMIIIMPLVTTCIDTSRVFQSTVMLTEITYLTLYCSDSVKDS